MTEARDQIAELTDDSPESVIFTSGATEANNLAILGLRNFILSHGPHVITTEIEHKAVLEPFEELEKMGVAVSFLPVNEGGWLDPEELLVV